MYYEGREIIKLANFRSMLLDDAIVEIWYYVWIDERPRRPLYCQTIEDAESYIDAMNAQQEIKT